MIINLIKFNFLSKKRSLTISQPKLDPQVRIAFIGGGNMAKAIIAGLLKHGHDPKNILVCAPSLATTSAIAEQYGVGVSQSNSDAVSFAHVLILAVKPFIVPLVCEELQPLLAEQQDKQASKLVISIAAGITHQTISTKLNNHSSVVCAMPNLPTAIGQGLTGMFTHNTTAPQRQLADAVMNAVGDTVWLEDEKQMSTIVATAGSSPAYFFLFLEAMEKAAIRQGLPANTATKAVLQSAMGAISMAMESQLDFAALRRQVTSPKGTTEQAILAFQDGDLDELVANAMNSAAERANELSLG
ncbi:pyrroline-5-carboxylate reductase [Shewanella sp. AS1]|uniref:pyrroline-5-carboxylate reductase n=1 Tax=Shewanella sp. AS1 TaxID=2907626 RepID=UPI001F46306B|nr:pyrroline-5-carboxylate reductase [Shewanella sp. AS1]MCE9679404.1 pyrroline-5-carboxylate reductase [Shewanella sp. AS1]